VGTAPPIIDLAGAGTRPGDDEAFEAVRIETGIPELGRELTERTIPQEAGDLVSRTVSFSKGCYTGQELVARIDARGSNTPRRLHGVLIDGAPPAIPPIAGDELVVGDAKVGELTSVAWSAGLLCHVALAYVKRGTAVPSEADTAGDGRSAHATIRSLPLVSG
jgi:folate-binding protein YgfZ